MTTQNWIALAGVILAVFGIIFAGGRLFERIGNIKEEINELKPDVKMIPLIKERVDVLWADRFTSSNSPVVLNERGLKILKESKIETLTNEYYAEIIMQVKELTPQNAYQAQEILIEVVKNLKNRDNCKAKLEEAAFVTGVDVDTVLLVAAINIRDKIIEDLQFKIGDIDKFAPPNK